MKTKTILSIAIMAALPFGAHADPVGPAAVPANGTAVVATANAPYVTQTPTAADATHIASTAYVKGAYNDAIAAVNKVANTVDGKQAQLVNFANNNAMYNKVLGSGDLGGLGGALIEMSAQDYAGLREDIAMDVSNGETSNPDEALISTGATFQIVRDAGRALKTDIDNTKQEKLTDTNGNDINTTLSNYSDMNGITTALISGDDSVLIDGTLLKWIPSVAAVAGMVKEGIDTQGVTIYTTWENDTASATTTVELSNLLQ